MSKPKEESQEMSMEEILSSIRRYVTDDEREIERRREIDKLVTSRAPSNDTPSSSPLPEDVLDLSKIEVRSEVPPPSQGPVNIRKEEGGESSFQQRSFHPHSSVPFHQMPTSFQTLPYEERDVKANPGTQQASPRPLTSPPSFSPPSFVRAENVSQEPQGHNSLASGNTVASSVQAFSKLTEAMHPQETDAPRSLESGLTIEKIATQAITPLLKSWIDENLSALVERLVRAEIENIMKNVNR